jgi:hypothetical protein
MIAGFKSRIVAMEGRNNEKIALYVIHLLMAKLNRKTQAAK